jgi:hypothetical protein
VRLKETAGVKSARSKSTKEFAAQVNRAGVLLAVAGSKKDVEQQQTVFDKRFWLCESVEPAYKTIKQIQVDEMLILPGQYAASVRWYTGERVVSTGVKYKLTSTKEFTIPLETCLKLSDLKWESRAGNVGVVSHADIERLNAQWAIEVLGSNI